MVKIEGLITTQLKQIHNPKGDIYHAMKKSDFGFVGFGEAYFSIIHKGDIKGWKKHSRMTMNIVVPIGDIEIVVIDDRENSITKGSVFRTQIGQSNYQRITVPPGILFAFKGINEISYLLNLASIEHDPKEVINIDLEEIRYEW